MNILKPTKQRKIKNRKLFAFDIETADDNKTFLCASLYGENYAKIFYSKDAFAEEIKKKRFWGAIICATNLSFDFFGMFFGTDYVQQFKTLFRGSELLYAKTYITDDGRFHPSPLKKHKGNTSITFIDSFNYIKMSVKQMGEIIGIEKIERPDWLGEHPKNEQQWDQLIRYNMQDSRVTYEFMRFLYDGFEALGATVKNTIASTAMSVFKNKYLDFEVFQSREEILLDQLEAYYGGRTETFKRGAIEDCNYYDINSLYPSVMHDFEYPDPNSVRVNHYNTVEYIRNYKGIAHVKIHIPDHVKIPPLPLKTPDKLIFPRGTIEGWWTHDELVNAEQEGCVIMHVYKTQYFTKTCRPFKRYVTDLYTKRLEYKAQNSPMELIVKLLLNSLYGKFCQRFLSRENYVPMDTIDIEDIGIEFEQVGDYARVIKDSKPAAFCVPIWGAYITSYARLRLYSYLKEHDPIYCDTDSIITKDTIPTSKELGKMKLEMHIEEGIIVRPKFYAVCNHEQEYVKIKGLGKRLTYMEFYGLLSKHLVFGMSTKVYYEKITKFKEALRRHIIPNETIRTHKEFGLEDGKRVWSAPFDMFTLQESEPILISSNQ